MSFLYSTHTATRRTPLHPSLSRAAAITLLQDFNAFPRLSPLITENKVIESPPPTSWIFTETSAAAPPGVIPEYHAITSTIPLGPFGSTSVTIKTGYLMTEDGNIVFFHAPIGLHGRNYWRVVTAEDGQGLVLLEEATLTGLAPLMPFIMTREHESHTEIGARFARKLERDLQLST